MYPHAQKSEGLIARETPPMKHQTADFPRMKIKEKSSWKIFL
jgi:hypothetical protein